MPRQPEVSRATLDRAHDLVGDVLVNIEAAGLHGQFSAERWDRLPASRSAGGRRKTEARADPVAERAISRNA
jgi:hypothetical protein